MAHHALTEDGTEVAAHDFIPDEWERLKADWRPGAFVLPCCHAPAVLKTSINGVQFFAHLYDDCVTAPESIWHREAKASVLAALHTMGIRGRGEEPGESKAGGRWRADVFFDWHGRRIAIELQRSTQTLREFLLRQERYVASGVECYWLARTEVFLPLAKAAAKLLLKRDFGNKWPPQGIGTGLLPELPIAAFKADAEAPVQFGLKKSASTQAWLEAILEGRYQYRGGAWNIG